MNLRGFDNIRELNTESIWKKEAESHEFFFDIKFRSKCEGLVDMEPVMLGALRAAFMDLDVEFNDINSEATDVTRRAAEEGHPGEVHRELGGNYRWYGDGCRVCSKDNGDRRNLRDLAIENELDYTNFEARMNKALDISISETMLELDNDPCYKEDKEKSIKVKIMPKPK